MSTTRSELPNPLPRELAPGVFWLGQCSAMGYKGGFLHSMNSIYVVAGKTGSAVIDTGAPFDLEVVEAQLDGLLEQGIPSVTYVFSTHLETNHSSGLGRLLARFPAASYIGDPTDFHLQFPQFVDRILDVSAREPLDLGGRELFWVPAIFRDLETTRWAFDTGSQALFAGDGMAYTHYHMTGHCGSTAEETMAAAESLDVEAMTQLFSDAAFYWLRFVDVEKYIARVDDLLEELDVQLICPCHGLPVADPKATWPVIRKGLRADPEAEEALR